MPEGIAQAFQSILPALQVGSTGFNLYNQEKNQQYQDTLRTDAQNPAKVTALAQQYTQPLTAGLTAAVNNQTQAQLAQAGLSESPQIAQTVEAEAIAPYIQQNQQAGYQDAIQALGLGGGAIPPALQQQNSIAALAKAFAQPGGTPPGTLQALQNYLRTMGTSSPQLNPAQFNPGAAPGPIDTSGLQQPIDLSSFYQSNPVTYAGDGGGDTGGYGDE
jgi:hypothetical protein